MSNILKLHEKYRVPLSVIYALESYVEHGKDPGGFLTACLCNDLRTALALSLNEYTTHIDETVEYIYTELPHFSRGSRERYDEWIYRKTVLEKAGIK
jgi:hypothetical protein